MARRSEHSREELVQLAVEAGIALIEEQGFSQFSARAAAARMGYTVGTLYHLFGSLDGYLLHLNAATLDLWHAELMAALKRKPKRPVNVLARAYIQFARDHYRRWTALFEHHLPEGTEIPDWYAAKLARLFALLEEPLLAHLGGDRKKAIRLSKILWSGIHGICVLSLSRKLEITGAEPAETMADALVDALLQ